MILFDCQNLYRKDTAIYYLRSDFDVECWKDDHLGWTFGWSFPMLLFWVFGVSWWHFARKIKLNKDNLYDPEIKKKFGFFYLGLKKEYYYWEGYVFIRKVALIFVLIVSNLNSANL